MRKYSIGAFLLDLERPDARDRPAVRAAARAERNGTRRLRAERRLQLRRRRPQRRADHPLRDVRLRQHVRHRRPGRRARPRCSRAASRGIPASQRRAAARSGSGPNPACPGF